MRNEIHHDAVLPPRAATFLAIAALHVLFAYLFISALAQSAFKEIIETTAVFVPEPAPPVEPIPTIKPDFVPPEAFLPLPDIVPDPVPDDGNRLVTVSFAPDTAAVADSGQVTGIPAPQPEPIRQLGTNRIPNAEIYYPATLKRQGIAGATIVRACRDERGRLQGHPVVQRSSGYEGFDKGAIQAARDGRYARATQGGKPVPNCYDFRINFVMTSR